MLSLPFPFGFLLSILFAGSFLVALGPMDVIDNDDEEEEDDAAGGAKEDFGKDNIEVVPVGRSHWV